ncbi:MAG: LysE family translocator [Proteobacteria bacterium]|nr:LysE family translocator [Pseudomonadota bacterium]
MTPTSLTAFVAASLLLAVTPGPGVIYIVTRTLAQGRAAGAASVAGVACGNFGNALGASIGLAALLAASALAYTLVKLAGAAYLVWLGIRMWRAPSADAAAAGAPLPPLQPMSPGRLFREGCVVALLNPKTAIFFAAFLPQFMQPGTPLLVQAVALGAAFVVIAACSDLAYALLASRLAVRLRGVRGAAAWGRRASGASLIALGAYSALAGHRAG